jgi:uncharacterized protein
MSDTPPPASTSAELEPAATDHRGLRVLMLDECLQLLRDHPVGRVGFLSDGEVVILPVNHVVQGTQVLFRTTWGSKLQSAEDEARVGYQVDHHDPTTRTGWSVLVQGTAEVVHDSKESSRLDALAPEPWLDLEGERFWIRILAVQISGREIVVRHRGRS